MLLSPCWIWSTGSVVVVSIPVLLVVGVAIVPVAWHPIREGLRVTHHKHWPPSWWVVATSIVYLARHSLTNCMLDLLHRYIKAWLNEFVKSREIMELYCVINLRKLPCACDRGSIVYWWNFEDVAIFFIPIYSRWVVQGEKKNKPLLNLCQDYEMAERG